MYATVGRCPLCGEMHSIPDARSMNPEEMGCNDLLMGGSMFSPQSAAPDDEMDKPASATSSSEESRNVHECLLCGFRYEPKKSCCPQCLHAEFTVVIVGSKIDVPSRQ